MANSKITGRRKRQLKRCPKCEHPFDVDKAQCPTCGSWDVPIEQVDDTDQTILLSDVSDRPIRRIENTGPWDCCFSDKGGLVTVGVYLIGGAPGAGKSTMALQLSDTIAGITNQEVMYVSAEEAKEQVKDRAQRMKIKNHALIRIYPMGANTDLGNIFRNRKPSAVIVDSLPALTGDPEQAVELCKIFKEYAVSLEIPFIVIDHVTKDEDFAGLMALQHEVDTTLLFTVLGTSENGKEPMRQLNVFKSRFGPLRSVFLEMTSLGLIQGEDPDNEDDDDWVR